jgi:hypothetical protein
MDSTRSRGTPNMSIVAILRPRPMRLSALNTAGSRRFVNAFRRPATVRGWLGTWKTSTPPARRTLANSAMYAVAYEGGMCWRTMFE